MKAGVELFVIRGASVSAEHISTSHEPLNLKKFIYELDVPVIVGGVAGYSQAKHLMRTGAAGVLVGFGGGSAQTTRQGLGISAPMATAIADVAAARSDYLDESGGRYVHVIADGSLGRSGDMVKALALGADAVSWVLRWLAPPRHRARACTGVTRRTRWTSRAACALRWVLLDPWRKSCTVLRTTWTAPATLSVRSSAQWLTAVTWT